MKLAQLLAKELKEWPEGVTHLTQSEVTNEIYNALEGNSEGAIDSLDHRFNTSSRHSERPYPIVSREQWYAEREKMNKPKWIRHRGGKCPVKAGTKVVTRYRDGLVSDWCMTRNQNTEEECLSAIWSHSGGETDIMAYYVEETKDQEIKKVKVTDAKLEMMHGDSWVNIGRVAPDFRASVFDGYPLPKPEEVKDANLGTLTYKLEIDATEATKEIDSLVAKWGQIVSPLKWRDAIIHCQAIIEDCEREIEKNVNLLDAEGLMMQKDSKKAMQHYAPDVDMSDWRNWKSGDIVECITSAYTGVYTMGQQYIVEWVDEDGFSVFDNYGGESSCDWFEHESEGLKFIRRP